ncbi:MAG: Na+/H+ antiporter subunit E [Ilumatobacteraceae bacterium]
MRAIGFALGLAVIWVLLWGSASPANVLTGLAIGAVLVRLVPGLRRRGPSGSFVVRPVAIARLVGHMLATVVTSNVVLTREVLSPSSKTRTAVVGVPLPGCSDELLTLITNLLALSPGTMPLELTQNPIVLYVHVLHLRDVDEVRREIQHLTDLTVRAFGSPDAVAAQDEYLATASGADDRPRTADTGDPP